MDLVKFMKIVKTMGKRLLHTCTPRPIAVSLYKAVTCNMAVSVRVCDDMWEARLWSVIGHEDSNRGPIVTPSYRRITTNAACDENATTTVHSPSFQLVRNVWKFHDPRAIWFLWARCVYFYCVGFVYGDGIAFSNWNLIYNSSLFIL